MNSVSSPAPSTDTTAVPASPAKATVGAMLSGIAVRSRRNRPAANTTMRTAPVIAIEW